MNKSLIMLTCAMLGGLTAYAAPVGQKTAGKVALNFISQQPGASSSMQVKSIEPMANELYLVNFAPAGFAVVSADDTMDPIVCYSTEGSLSMSLMPNNMYHMIGEASEAVKLKRASTATPSRLWTSYENGAIVQSRGGERVEPLISVNWDQGSPYNQYCPGEGSSKALVGCVAVAMSQAMSVQQYPVKPSGRHSYSCAGYGTIEVDFDTQENYDWNAILKGTDGKKEVARLLYHAGVSVSMAYGTDGSGIPTTQVYRISDALKEFFGYGSDVTYTWRSNYKGDWEQLLLNELYADRAIVYNAVDAKGGYGHSFNVDGYDGDGKFHINWGWGGYGNSYFAIDALKDAQMNMNYDSNHVAVTGIGGGNSAFRSIQLSDLSVEANQPAGSYVSAILVNGEPIDVSAVNVNVTGEYDASTGSYKDTPVEYVSGLLKTKRELSLEDGPLFVRVEITMKNDKNTKLRQGFTIEVESHKTLAGKTSLKYERDTRMFTVHTKYGATVKVTNAQGTAVAVAKDPLLPNYTFRRDDLTSGTNRLELTLDGETSVVNIEK